MRRTDGKKIISRSILAMMVGAMIITGGGVETVLAKSAVIQTSSTSSYKVVTADTYKKSVGNLTANIQTPKVQGSTTAIKNFNKKMAAYTAKIKKDFESDIKIDQNGYEEVTTTYQVKCNNENFLSIQIETGIVMAGSNQFSKGFTLDKKTGKIITLKDLFKENSDYQTVISKNIIAQMKAQMEKDESKSYFIGEDNGMNFEKIGKYQNFFINGKGRLVISFDKYEVAPGYMGSVNFVIPKTAIANLLKATYQ